MIGEIPIVSFDTSAHNRLVDDPHSELVVAAMKSMWFRFAGLSIEELYANSSASRREKLFASCRNIHDGPSEFFLPSNLLTGQLILAHFKNPASFNWKTVDVRWQDCAREIRNPKFYEDELVSDEQRAFQRERKQSGRERFVKLRPEIQTILESYGECPPTNCREAITRLDKAENSAIWFMAQSFYDRVTTADSTEATVKQFAFACPPFLALIYANFLPWYNNAVRDPKRGERVVAGSNDLYMSVYLPYVDTFVTDDNDQERALREAAYLAKLETKILSYDDFCASLRLAAQSH